MKKANIILGKISKITDTGARWLCILCITAVFVMCLEQVFCRFVLHSSVGYVDELSRYVFILAVFVGSAISVRDEEHFSLDLIQTMLKSKPRALAAMRLAEWSIISAFLYFMTKSAVILAKSTVTQFSSYLHIKICWMYWIIAACGVWMIVYAVVKVVQELVKLTGKGESAC